MRLCWDENTFFKKSLFVLMKVHRHGRNSVYHLKLLSAAVEFSPFVQWHVLKFFCKKKITFATAKKSRTSAYILNKRNENVSTSFCHDTMNLPVSSCLYVFFYRQVGGMLLDCTTSLCYLVRVLAGVPGGFISVIVPIHQCD